MAEKKSPIGPERYFVVGIIVLQLLFSLRYAGTLLELTRTGAFSFLYLGATTLSLALLVVGAFLTVSGARAATYVFAFAAIIAALLLLQHWRPLFSITCPIVALSACIYTAWIFRRTR